ncbi:MAG TPA: nucleoside deaminase [Pyrinomonadaceae bacterium]|nr:nucleoside deaminase [Pyrinomonadaceae bacterium]
MSAYQEQFMLRAIELARSGMEANAGGPFGSVVVNNGRIVGEGNNRVTSTNDPTAHAEIVAIREACRHLDTFELAGSVIYASCEPCPMCLAAIYWSRAERIYIACDRNDAARAGFDDAYIYNELSADPATRRVPIEQRSRDAGIAVFEEWIRKPDKVEY